MKKILDPPFCLDLQQIYNILMGSLLAQSNGNAFCSFVRNPAQADIRLGKITKKQRIISSGSLVYMGNSNPAWEPHRFR